MLSIRSSIAAGVTLAALGFSFAIAANSGPEADGASAAPGDKRNTGIVVAQRTFQQVFPQQGFQQQVVPQQGFQQQVSPQQVVPQQVVPQQGFQGQSFGGRDFQGQSFQLGDFQPSGTTFGPFQPVRPTTDPAVLARLETQKAILNAHGVTDLSRVGALSFSGIVVPQPGFVRGPIVVIPPSPSVAQVSPAVGRSRRPVAVPAPQPAPAVRTAVQEVRPSNMTTAPTIVHNARGLKLTPAQAAIAGRGDGVISLNATKIMGEPLVLPVQPGVGRDAMNAQETVLPVNTAYWVASTINFPNNTTIVVQPNVRFLVIIATSITVGSNVTLTYEDVPVINPPAVPGKPSTVPGKPSTPNPFTVGTPGSQGYSGTQPPQIGTPPDAPQVELWTLAINQLPTIVLKGQYGYQGVRGGDGGDGGPGGNGSDSDHNLVNCKDGPESGGNGGKGGRGGDGGHGGNGGTGGRWSFYIPALPPSITVDVSGGERGAGGDPGSGGNGGPGGSRGTITGVCANQNWPNRHDGAAGPGGDPGLKGPDGVAGSILPNSINQAVVDPTDFGNKLLEPAIQHVYPEYPNTATVGSTLTIDGLNFTSTDTVTIGGVAVVPTFIADTKLQAIVPNTWGGTVQVHVVRVGNTATSNTASFYLKPFILSTVPPSPSSRLRPGATVIVNGTGFSQQMAVRVNHQDIATVTATSSQSLSFVMLRPVSIPHDPLNAGGEPAMLSVANNAPIVESDAIPIVIATFQILVLGDSVIWSEGLQDPDKIHSLVEAYEQTLHPGMSVYKRVEAHTGAVLDWSVSTSGTAHDGDIPQDYPSVQQQANARAGLPTAATIDLILLTACANDVGFEHFLDPLATHASIAARVSQYCGTDMTAFLAALASQFPAAMIVVAGYYPGLSLYTDPAYFINLVGVLYGLENNHGLAPDLLAASIGLTPAAVPIVADNAAFFASQANLRLAGAVTAANASVNRIHFANPGFGLINAANASNAWVFGLSGGIPPGPTDSSASLSRRETQCAAVYATSSFDYKFCKLASAGHPNEIGATKYFAAIKPFL